MKKVLLFAIGFMLVFCCNASAWGKKEIIHDAECYVLEVQHGEKWAKEDKELKKKLAVL